jgi:Na+/H+-dicarboxylate symporter
MDPDRNDTEKMSSKPQTSLLLATLAGTILGGLLGYYLPDLMLSFSFIGQLFVNALRILVVPFVVASVIVGIAALANIGRVNRAIGKSLFYFGVTSIIAVAIGYALVEIIQPGAGVSTQGATAPAELTRVTSFSVNQVVSSILPESLLGATAQGNLLGLVIFALFIGATVIVLEGKGKAVVDFFGSLNEVLARLIQLVLYAAPVGLLFLVATAVAQSAHSSSRMLSSVGLFSLTVLAAFVIQGLVILPLALKLLAKRNFWGYLGSTAPALLTAFGTASPVATLPITVRSVVGNGNVDSRAGSVTLPLGAMINMNGTALYLVIGAFFCAQVFQVDLSILQVAGVIAMAFLLSIAASLIPHGSLLILGVLLFSVNFPIEAYAAIGLLLVVDWFFERLRATLNVWGDAVGAAVIAETFEFKTARKVTPSDSPRRQKPTRRGDSSRRRDKGTSPREKQRSAPKERKPDRDSRRKDQRRDSKRRNGSRSDRPQRGRKVEVRKSATTEKKPRSEKSGAFEMPTPPYHVLEGELKAKEPVASGGNGQSGGLSDETIQRERAKIAAQLAEMRQKEARPDEKVDREPSAVATTEPWKTDDSPDIEESQEKFPRVDFFSEDDSPTPETGESTPDSGTSEQESDGASDETKDAESKTAAFGRKKARRGAAVKSPASSKEESNEEEEPKPEFSSDNMSFGRGKRKKPGA